MQQEIVESLAELRRQSQLIEIEESLAELHHQFLQPRQQREVAWLASGQDAEPPVTGHGHVDAHVAPTKRSQDDHLEGAAKFEGTASRDCERSRLGTVCSGGALVASDELACGGDTFEGVD